MDKVFFEKNGYIILDQKNSKINIDSFADKIFKKLMIFDLNEFNFIKKKSKNLKDLLNNINKIEKNHKISSLIYKYIPTMIDVWQFSSQPKILKILKELEIPNPTFSTVPCMRIDRPNENYFATPWHQDYWYSFASDKSITIWFPLIHVTKKMGRLFVIPESHNKGLLSFQNTTNSNDPFVLSHKANYLKTKEKEVNVPYGSILIFNQYLLHRSGLNKSNKCRISMQLRYNSLDKGTAILSSFEAKSTKHVYDKQKKILNMKIK